MKHQLEGKAEEENVKYAGGIATTLIVLFTLKGLSATENHLFKVKYKELVVYFKERPGLLGRRLLILSWNPAFARWKEAVEKALI